MARNIDIGAVTPETFVLGLSQIYRIPAIPFQSVITLKKISGNTLELGGTFVMTGGGLSGGVGTTAAFTWANGYLVGQTEVLTFNCTGDFYLACTGATVTLQILRQLGNQS